MSQRVGSNGVDSDQSSVRMTPTISEHADPAPVPPVLRAFLLGSFMLERVDGGSLDVFTSIGRSQSILLLKLLLCHPQRRINRDVLTEIIWPGQSYSTMDGSLGVAKSLLKTGLQALCGQTLLPRANGDPPSYRLVGQSVLWTDIDACEQSIRRAIATTNATEALVQWETAYALVQRGVLLADDQVSYWYQAHLVQDRRKKLAKQRVQCVLRIADLALECGTPDRAVTVLNEESEVHPANEEIALHLMELLAQRGQRAEALHCYARLEAALLERDTEPKAETQALAHRLRSGGTTRASVNKHLLLQSEEMGRSVTEAVDNLPTQDKEDTTIPTIGSGSEAAKHRDFLHETGRSAVAGTVLLGSHEMLSAELLDRFQWALKKPSTLDERLLNYLQIHTEGYWRDRHSAALASTDLLDYVIEHFQKVTQLLEGPMLPSQRIQLCVIASKTAQLAGHLLFDMGNFVEARQFHQAAIMAAQEVDNHALQATAWARISFTWTYSNNAPEALRCIEQARCLAIGSTNSTVRAYLAAVEAEIQAILGDSTGCLKALNQAEHIEDQQYSLEDSYWLRFDRSRLAGYKGICFRRLYRPGNPQTISFLREGQNALKEALAQLSPTRIQRKPVLLIDLADTCTLRGDIEAACEYATQAIPLIDQIKSQAAFRRLLKIRQALKPWQETQHIQNLDSQMAQYSFLRRFDSEEISI